MKNFSLVKTKFLILSLVILYGCAQTTPIQLADNSASAFDGAVYSGETVVISHGSKGNKKYRVFHQGATGFVSVQSVRESVQKRADEFCKKESRLSNTLSETTSLPPHILGNFPRIELIFECIDKPLPTGVQKSQISTRYEKIEKIKQLFDSGALTKEEFDAEKAKILSTDL